MGEVFALKDVTQGVDITPYVTSYTWSGSLGQAARKLDFVIAYTVKDRTFQNLKLELGDRVELSVTQEDGSVLKLFSGVIFLRDRKSGSDTMELTAYDNLIYLSKSHLTMKFSGCPIRDVIKQVCGALGVTVGELKLSDLDSVCDFIADDQAGSDIIKQALEVATAATGWRYNVFMKIDQKTGEQKLEAVRADEKIEHLILSDTGTVTGAAHASSIEDMINQVGICDKDGNITGYVHNDDDVKRYGLLQALYKVDDKHNTEKCARAMLKKVQEHSTVEAVGNIQCIAGYAVEVQEEQIKGTFLITSDTHKIENNLHTMSLTLDYIVPPDDGANASKEGNVNPLPNPDKQTGTGSNPVDEGLDAGASAWLGTTMDNGTNGCAEAVGKIGSYYSPFLAQECNNGVVYVPTMVADAGENCIPFDASQVEKGDVIVYGDNDHVVIAAGPNGEYVGNSSSQNQVVRGGDFYNMGGLYPTKIIKTSHM